MSEIPEWIDGPEIRHAVISLSAGGHPLQEFEVGQRGVTRIERAFKSGEFSHIPYIRIWRGDHALSEWCQHKIVGVYFEEPAA